MGVRFESDDDELRGRTKLELAAESSGAALRGVLTTLAKEVYSSGQATAIKHLTDAVALLENTPDTDGGTADLAARHKTMKQGVVPALDEFRAGLTTDYATAKADLTALLGAINTTQRTVSPTELASIKTAAQKWCTAWTTKGAAVVQCSSATTNVTNFDPPIASSDAFYRNIGSITDCSAGTTLVNSKCPEGTVALNALVKVGFQNARDEYHSRDTIRKTKCDAETVAGNNEGSANTTYVTRLATILDAHFNSCSATVHTDAALAFNTNNKRRVHMYEMLDKIVCHLKNTTTLITSCINALANTNYHAMFANYTTTPAACPTRADYASAVSGHQGLLLTESWAPSNTTCAAVLATTTTTTTTTLATTPTEACVDLPKVNGYHQLSAEKPSCIVQKTGLRGGHVLCPPGVPCTIICNSCQPNWDDLHGAGCSGTHQCEGARFRGRGTIVCSGYAACNGVQLLNGHGQPHRNEAEWNIRCGTGDEACGIHGASGICQQQSYASLAARFPGLTKAHLDRMRGNNIGCVYDNPSSPEVRRFCAIEVTTEACEAIGKKKDASLVCTACDTNECCQAGL